MKEKIRVRNSLRLKRFDYASEGYYFVTICAFGRKEMFGEMGVRSGSNAGPIMRLNRVGMMIESVWQELPIYYSGVELDEFIVMPNHFHGIIVIKNTVGGGFMSPLKNDRADIKPAPTLSDIICAFKSKTTNLYCQAVKQNNWPPFSGKLWQRNYYDRIVRSEPNLNRIREYILDNPMNWIDDPENVNS